MRLANYEDQNFLLLEDTSEVFLANQAVDRVNGNKHHVAQHLREIIDDVVHDCAVEAVAVFDESEAPIVMRAISAWAKVEDNSVESAQARHMMDSLAQQRQAVVTAAASQAA